MSCPSCDGTISRAIQQGREVTTWKRCDPCAEREAALWARLKDAIIAPAPAISRRKA